MNSELVYVVDATDRIIGTATRAQVHGNPEMIHRVVHVLVFNNQGDLFLQKRSLQKDVQPGKWDTSVGGHVDFGESYRQAANREINEELGIEPAQLEFLYTYCHSNQYESEFVATFRCVWNGEFIINRQELTEGRFWQLDEIKAQADTAVFTPNFLEELQRYQAFIMNPPISKDLQGASMFTKHADEGYRTPVTGVHYKTLAYGDKTLLAEFKLEKGNVLPQHEHPYEQTGYLVSGRINLIFDGQTHEVHPGDSWCIPGGMLHQADIIEDSIAIEVFSPVRPDYLP